MKKEIIIFSIAVALFAGIFTASIFISNRIYEFPINSDRLNIVVMGDSIMDNNLEGNNICSLLNNYIEADVCNCAIGGSTATGINKGNEIDYYADKFNFYNLSDIAVTGNMTSVYDNRYVVENTTRDGLYKTSFLVYTDLSNTDVLIIQYGMNDSTVGIPASGEDKYDQTTFGGVMRTGVEQIHEQYPDLKIILNTVTYAHIEYETAKGNFVLDTDANGIKEAYNNELRSIAEDNDNVYLFDASEFLDINEDNYRDYLIDGIHFNVDTKKIFAEHMADYLRELQ